MRAAVNQIVDSVFLKRRVTIRLTQSASALCLWKTRPLSGGKLLDYLDRVWLVRLTTNRSSSLFSLVVFFPGFTGVQIDCHIVFSLKFISDCITMARFFQPLLFMLAKCQEDQLVRQIEFLKAENEMLRKRVPKKRIFLKPSEQAKLLELGRELGPAIRHLITIVSYSTFRRWVRKADGITEPTRKGRPRLDAQLRELVVRIAKETGWGYSKILGELKKLKVGKISRQSVKNILIEHGFDPGPKRGKGTWSEFLHVHKETLWQIDFFSKRVWTVKGPRQVFALALFLYRTRLYRAFTVQRMQSTG